MIKKNFFVYVFSFLLLATAVQAIGSFPTVTSDMILIYKFNNNSAIGENASVVKDNSTYGNNGTIRNANLTFNATGGILGDGSYYFPAATNNYVNTTNNFVGNLSQGLTVRAWIQTGTLVSGDGDIVTRYASQNGNRSWALSILDGKVRFTGSTDGISLVTVTGTTVIANNSGWTYVASVWNGSNTMVFVNGVLDSGFSTLASIIESPNVPIEIGKAGPNTYFNGSIDNVIVSNRSYTAKQIYEEYITFVGCINATEGMSIPGNTVLCPGQYNFSGDTSHIAFTNDNSILDCNGAELNGQGFNSTLGTGVHGGGYTNVTVKNCIIHNFTQAVWFNLNKNSTVDNLTAYDLYQSGVYVRQTANTTVKNSRFNGTIGMTGHYAAIQVYSASNGSMIINNTINSSQIYYGVAINADNNGSDNIVKNNYIYSGGQHGVVVQLLNNRTVIFNNTIEDAGWNGIDLEAYNANVSYNTIRRSTHHGIDMWGGVTDNLDQGGRNKIHNNQFINTTYSAIYIRSGYENDIYDNIINRVINTTTDQAGIAIEGNTQITYNNRVYRNNISNVGYGIYDGATNSTYYQNNITVASLAEILLMGFFNNASHMGTPLFYSNTLPSNAARVYYGNSRVNATYNISGATNYYVFNNTAGTGVANTTVGNLNNSIVLYSNGTYVCSTYCNGSKNLSIGAGLYAILYNNYNGSISFLDLYPVSATPSVVPSSSLVFNYSLINPAGLSTNTNWFVDGVNQSACYNLSSCSVSASGLSVGYHDVNLSVAASSNTITSYWQLYVSEGDLCSDVPNGSVVRTMIIVAILIAVASLYFLDLSGTSLLIIALVALSIFIAIASSALTSVCVYG